MINDTTYTAGKLEIMQAFIDKKQVQYKNNEEGKWMCLLQIPNPQWLWTRCYYRIKPQTVEEAANDYCSTYLSDSAQSSIKDAVIFGAKWQKEQDNK